MIDDPADGQIGEDGVIGTGMTGSGSACREDPIAFTSTNGIDRDEFLALVVFENPQVHVVQSRDAERADQRAHHLHDFHQLAAPPLGFAAGCWPVVGAGAEDEVFGGSGSQWSMIPTIVRSLG